ncbi:MAG TPA: acyl carrier protein [Gemmatimonadales bacterium]|jgi:acyl carrier protein|nr:acyl carrier protein [Gemmatimonadales bacterium]
MDEPAILARTRAYVRDTFLYMRPGFALGDADRLLQRGVIDSMGVMELIGFLKSEFGVVVADEEITEQNLGTLADIARYVAGKRGNGRGSGD